MKLLLDTCVLYPTVMRDMLVGVARQGGFEPLWSPRILEEWRRASLKHGPEAALEVEGQAAVLNTIFPKALQRFAAAQETRFWLPDPADRHVLATASLAGADGIVTLNNKDFPGDILAEEGVRRVNPDALLLGIWQAQPALLEPVAHMVLNEINACSETPWTLRKLLKKARLPRLGKALDAA